MAIRFRPWDFLQPAALWSYRSLLARAQWWPPERLRAYQLERARAIVRHAVATVPYYRAYLRDHDGRVDTVRTLHDLQRLPALSKSQVREHGDDLRTTSTRTARCFDVTTTGSTGLPVRVTLDRHLNALEFAFYWRQWGWFGYRLGDRFAQLSWAEFRNGREEVPVIAQRGTGRLLLNALHLTDTRATELASAMRRHRAVFLKGHPSALFHFASFVRAKKLALPPLKAVFATGEVFEPSMRSLVRHVFDAPVADAYGSMERVVAACECPKGRLHVNADYGLWETVDVARDPVTGKRVGKILGTGLYNRSMPLVRYDTGDLVELPDEDDPCPCGRSLPTVGRLIGRSVDAIITPGNRVVASASIVFNHVTGILQGQLVQDEIDRLLIRVLPAPGFGPHDERRLRDEASRLFGTTMRVEIERVLDHGTFAPPGEKFRAVVSRVAQDRAAAAVM